MGNEKLSGSRLALSFSDESGGRDENRGLFAIRGQQFACFRHLLPQLAARPVLAAQRHKQVTYVNITAAPTTWPIIEAQGFRAYCSGLFFSFPALSRAAAGMRVEIISKAAQAIDGLSVNEVALLAHHAACGCLSIVCRTADGRAFPFILQPMRMRSGRIALPAMQLIHCRDVSQYVACAGAIGRLLLARGKFSVAVDANGPVPGLTGFYTKLRGRKYFKGPRRPRHGDLADTELVVYGP